MESEHEASALRFWAGDGAVSLALVRASGADDAPPCAGKQTLTGSVGSTGTVMQLALANSRQTSPATPFSGRATRPGTTTPASTFTTTSKKLITCTGRNKICREVFAVTVRTGKGPLVAHFTTSSRHCSDARLRISVDGGPKRLSPYLGPSKSTPEYTFEVAAGQHRVQVRAKAGSAAATSWTTFPSGRERSRSGLSARCRKARSDPASAGPCPTFGNPGPRRYRNAQRRGRDVSDCKLTPRSVTPP